MGNEPSKQEETQKREKEQTLRRTKTTQEFTAFLTLEFAKLNETLQQNSSISTKLTKQDQQDFIAIVRDGLLAKSILVQDADSARMFGTWFMLLTSSAEGQQVCCTKDSFELLIDFLGTFAKDSASAIEYITNAIFNFFVRPVVSSAAVMIVVTKENANKIRDTYLSILRTAATSQRSLEWWCKSLNKMFSMKQENFSGEEFRIVFFQNQQQQEQETFQTVSSIKKVFSSIKSFSLSKANLETIKFAKTFQQQRQKNVVLEELNKVTTKDEIVALCQKIFDKLSQEELEMLASKEFRDVCIVKLFPILFSSSTADVADSPLQDLFRAMRIVVTSSGVFEQDIKRLFSSSESRDKIFLPIFTRDSCSSPLASSNQEGSSATALMEIVLGFMSELFTHGESTSLITFTTSKDIQKGLLFQIQHRLSNENKISFYALKILDQLTSSSSLVEILKFFDVKQLRDLLVGKVLSNEIISSSSFTLSPQQLSLNSPTPLASNISFPTSPSTSLTLAPAFLLGGGAGGSGGLARTNSPSADFAQRSPSTSNFIPISPRSLFSPTKERNPLQVLAVKILWNFLSSGKFNQIFINNNDEEEPTNLLKLSIQLLTTCFNNNTSSSSSIGGIELVSKILHFLFSSSSSSATETAMDNQTELKMILALTESVKSVITITQTGLLTKENKETVLRILNIFRVKTNGLEDAEFLLFCLDAFLSIDGEVDLPFLAFELIQTSLKNANVAKSLLVPKFQELVSGFANRFPVDKVVILVDVVIELISTLLEKNKTRNISSSIASVFGTESFRNALVTIHSKNPDREKKIVTIIKTIVMTADEAQDARHQKIFAVESIRNILISARAKDRTDDDVNMTLSILNSVLKKNEKK